MRIKRKVIRLYRLLFKIEKEEEEVQKEEEEEEDPIFRRFLISLFNFPFLA